MTPLFQRRGSQYRSWRLVIAVIFASTLFATETVIAGETDQTHEIFVETDAHEGPVIVPHQNRLYFTSKPDFGASDTFISIRFVDLETGEVETFVERSNMANGMWLTRDGEALLVAEQGTRETPAAITRISLADGGRTVLVDDFEGKPLNSPNKAIEAKNGWIYFSDPDYGYNQGFKHDPVVPMAVYAHDPTNGRTVRLTTESARPHGLALLPDENILYIGDTDAIDGRHPYDADSTHHILAAPLLAPDRIGEIRTLLSVPVGIPDGFITRTSDGHLFVAAGDGLRQYTPEGEFVALFPIPGGAFNVTAYGDAYFSTADTAIWRTEIDE
ncbi:SMP-30/gluconolactonase/LRE family protein [Hoeflea sp. WL0058]|uniref:SMP-30/gluconolactonase/LRE family protein n=1 Tax=Flavimaribacter sediminis TaxID=2865987 RepID=A0AAE2ZML9_9HYPH|nr:SMP-30/gluconolactonase/LRE family protein [Flavimaribacter sediminis]MBW8639423.1 SMP-30/gluconolactonase/LRE family protein [Flavimaribacter sediminis]